MFINLAAFLLAKNIYCEHRKKSSK